MLTKTDLNQISKVVKTEADYLESKLNKRFDKLDRKLDYAINFLDRDFIKLLHRVEVIEEHLGIHASTP
jgi:hypothetical protein